MPCIRGRSFTQDIELSDATLSFGGFLVARILQSWLDIVTRHKSKLSLSMITVCERKTLSISLDRIPEVESRKCLRAVK